MDRKTKVIVTQLGGPKSPSVPDVRNFLKEFLSDPRVVDLPRFFWMLILGLFVLPFRPKRSARAYKRVFENGESPLVFNTERFCQGLNQQLKNENIEVEPAFLIGHRGFAEIYQQWNSEDVATRAGRWIFLPQFPQYCESTTASVVDKAFHTFQSAVNIPDFQFVNSFHNLRAFIDVSVKNINHSLSQNQVDTIVISFHGLPLRRILQKKDQYYQHCMETFHRLKAGINFDQGQIHFAFQSRFGREEWLGPATDQLCSELAQSGKKNILVYCPSFVADCLETTDEIGTELSHQLEQQGANLVYVPCLNDQAEWVNGYAQYIKALANGDQKILTQLHYPPMETQFMPEQKMESIPLNDKAKRSIKILFLTLFLDLVGFSIIFPMFPAMAKYYLEFDHDSTLLKAIFGIIESVSLGGTINSNVVLFGGVLGALYALLQFVFAPIWGSLSDIYGRKKILKITMFAMGISYLIWGLAGSFWVLLLGRAIGGIMGGNLSVATAAVADVTDESNRSKGMAYVGIAFALGFILGPALGGILTMIDLTKIWPQLVPSGINPFSTPAFVAMILSFINYIIISVRFEETYNPEVGGEQLKRSSNPIALLRPLPYPGINNVNYSYFLFITAFSGMEFTLTFLAVERLNYSPMQNAYMFIFIGVLIALVQGGYVRRKASRVGERKMAIQGLIGIVPGLLILAYATNSLMIYIGLLFLAVGSSMAIPTLTALSSLHAPAQVQGRVLGIFRSLGSLGRVIGPVVASLIYWKFGSSYPYLLGAAFMLIPVLMLARASRSSSAS